MLQNSIIPTLDTAYVDEEVYCQLDRRAVISWRGWISWQHRFWRTDRRKSMSLGVPAISELNTRVLFILGCFEKHFRC